jgi:Ca2+/Na+ antiporter
VSLSTNWQKYSHTKENIGGQIFMVVILIGILSLISITCFIDGKSERKGLKLILSITLTVLLSYIIEATKHSLLEAGILEGIPLIILYFVLPIISFIIFQILLYDIRELKK